jgi:hypothetical protein
MAAKTTNLPTSEDGKPAKIARSCRFSREAISRRMVVLDTIGTIDAENA